MLKAIGIAALAFALVACSSGKTKRVDIADDDELMGTGLESGDVESIGTLGEDLLGVPQLTGPGVEGVPTIAIFPIRNETSQDLDAELLVRRIRAALVNKVRGKIAFVIRNERDLAMIEKERQQKRSGEYTASKQETKTGADFYLTGVASSLSKAGRGLESNAFWLDFQLIDAETGDIVWEGSYKTKKVGKAGVIYR